MPQRFSPGCHTGNCGCTGGIIPESQRCRCPGCDYCIDNKSPREITVTLNTLTFTNAPCTDPDCEALEYSAPSVKREYVFRNRSSFLDCTWDLIPTSITLPDGDCKTTVLGGSAVNVEGTIELETTGDPDVILGVITLNFGSLGILVFTKEFDISENLIDCNTDLDDDWDLDAGESTESYCEAVSASVVVTPCVVPCCDGCDCCGPTIGIGRKIYELHTTLKVLEETGTYAATIEHFNDNHASETYQIPVSQFIDACPNSTPFESFGPWVGPQGNYFVLVTAYVISNSRCHGVETDDGYDVGTGLVSDSDYCCVASDFELYMGTPDSPGDLVYGGFSNYFAGGETQVAKYVDCENDTAYQLYDGQGAHPGEDLENNPAIGTLIVKSRPCYKIPECDGVCFPDSAPIYIWLQIFSAGSCNGIDGDIYRLERTTDSGNPCPDDDCGGCCYEYETVYGPDDDPLLISFCIDSWDDGGTLRPRYTIKLIFDEGTMDEFIIIKRYENPMIDIASELVFCVEYLTSFANPDFSYVGSNTHPDCGGTNVNITESF